MKRKCRCYIEEYDNGRKARLRDKKTDKKVSMITDDPQLQMHLLAFLSAARNHGLDVFSSSSGDSVLVEGNLLSETEEEVEIAHDDQLTYIFE